MAESETSKKDDPSRSVAASTVSELVSPDRAAQSRLLDSVAAFTHHRDIDALDHSLVITLAELSSAHSVALARRGDGPSGIVRCEPDGQGGYRLSAVEPDPADPLPGRLQRCMERAEVQMEMEDDLHRLLVPIQREGRPIAALQLECAMPPAASRPLAEGFARIYANYTALLHESERDKLTGLYNRRSLERQLQALLQQHEQALQQQPSRELPAHEQPQVWLAILDIDHFKRINDTYGHIYGDEVILLLAQQMRASFRRDDVLFRFGGEEFVVLFGALGEHSVQAALERFRQRVAGYGFPQVGRVTVSVGYARAGRYDYPERVLDRADKALYYVKQHGRDGVRGYENLRECGLLDEGVTAGSIDLF
ncbi:MAG: GGDEF domain-containing protein [Rhodanobacter sp.]|jgi:diguanylate cyclase (GGDEF)-like protein|uniref:GGDEF domain-containing protein n=1 Tax=Rhodanobacter sp. KK11 TaxID=3083255 RepID=UPI002966005C|nr:GGDEF domain-containing protein [Rhodanobacter sp. KK11]MDW2980000.1 GGDEF domain-containing protein [Rhodanobacter sp. KK11]